MNRLITILSLLYSCSIVAANIPEDSLGAQKFDKLQCINNTTQDCINTQCMTSKEIDCQENCQKMAEAKCRFENND